MTAAEAGRDNPGRRVKVTHGRHGWEVMVLKGNEVVERVSCSDWHRVERAVVKFDRTPGRVFPEFLKDDNRTTR